MKLLLVRAGRGRFGVAADAVIQILDPAIDPDLKVAVEQGEVVHRGRRFPIEDLREETGRPSVAAPVYVLLEKDGRCAAVGVDCAESIRDVDDGAVAPLPGFIFALPRRVQALVEVEGDAVLLLDMAAIL